MISSLLDYIPPGSMFLLPLLALALLRGAGQVPEV
jgi:hypothetical protein